MTPDTDNNPMGWSEKGVEAFSPPRGAGTNEREECYQRWLAEYCRKVGKPSSVEAEFLRSRRKRHSQRRPGSKVRSREDLGKSGTFVEVYQLTQHDRELDFRNLPRPAAARLKPSASSQVLDVLGEREHTAVKVVRVNNLADKYSGVFLQRARDSNLEGLRVTEVQRAEHAYLLARNPPKIYKMDWDPSKPFPHRTNFEAADAVDCAQVKARGRDMSPKNQQLGGDSNNVVAGGDGWLPLESGTNQARSLLEHGKQLISRPLEPVVADAAAAFRLSNETASGLTMEGQPMGRLGANSVGAILRREKLRRLEKVVRLAVLRETAPKAGQVYLESRHGPARNDHAPRAFSETKARDGAYPLGLTEDQNAEVEMLMGMREVDFDFLRRGLDEAEGRTDNARPSAPAPGTAPNKRLAAAKIGRRKYETPTDINTGVFGSAGEGKCGDESELQAQQGKHDQHAHARGSSAIEGVTLVVDGMRRVAGQIRRVGAGSGGLGLKEIRVRSRELLNLAQVGSAHVKELVVVKSAAAYVASARMAVQLTAGMRNDEKNFMKQDEFVLYASEGDMRNVRKGLAENRFCSVKGIHTEIGQCAFFAAGLSLITVESEERHARSRVDASGPNGKYLHVSAGQLQRQLEKMKKKRDSLVSVLEYLLEEGSDPSCRQGNNNRRFEVGWSLLHHLARVGDHVRLLWLLHHGADVDAADRLGTTPLLLAAVKGKVKSVAVLLTRGADIRRRGPSGTALHMAALGGGALVTRALVAAGADPAARDDLGNTPLDIARMCNLRATVDVLTVHKDRLTPASALIDFLSLAGQVDATSAIVQRDFTWNQEPNERTNHNSNHNSTFV